MTFHAFHTLPWVDIEIAGGILLMAIILFVGWRFKRRPRKLNPDYFYIRWQDAQHFCGDKITWPQAVIEADKLLDEALRKLRYRGKTMGERLVAAQHDLSDNDGVWFGHKLRNKLDQNDFKKLRKKQVREALLGLRQALKDLGALR